MAAVQAWLVAFAFTQLVEVPIYVTGLRTSLWAAVGASTLTHPLLWFAFFPNVPLPYLWKLAVAESLVVLVEAAYFRLLFHRPRALRWSLVANAASFGTGMLSRWLLGAP